MKRLTQQSLTSSLGETRALRSCAPTCFFMVAKAVGYLRSGVGSDLASFCQSLDWDKAYIRGKGWVRPRLAEDLRLKYGLVVVSWQLGGNFEVTSEKISLMISHGYLRTDEEVAFFQNEVIDKDIQALVTKGYPVIVGVKPGFGGNKSAHAVVVKAWTLDGVEVLDPDERNSRSHYDEAYMRSFLNDKGGGCTIVLPHPIHSYKH